MEHSGKIEHPDKIITQTTFVRWCPKCESYRNTYLTVNLPEGVRRCLWCHTDLPAPPVAEPATEEHGWCPSCPCETSEGRKECACQCHGNPFAEAAPTEPSEATELPELDVNHPYYAEAGREWNQRVPKDFAWSPFEVRLIEERMQRERQLRDYKAKYEAALREIAELPWVASSERMPEDRHEWCIVIYNDVVQHMPATYEDGWWYWADDETDPLESDHVSHWLSIRTIAKLRGNK